MEEDINVNINLNLVKIQINKIVEEIWIDLNSRSGVLISFGDEIRKEIKDAWKEIIIKNLEEIIKDLKMPELIP